MQVDGDVVYDAFVPDHTRQQMIKTRQPQRYAHLSQSAGSNLLWLDIKLSGLHQLTWTGIGADLHVHQLLEQVVCIPYPEKDKIRGSKT